MGIQADFILNWKKPFLTKLAGKLLIPGINLISREVAERLAQDKTFQACMKAGHIVDETPTNKPAPAKAPAAAAGKPAPKKDEPPKLTEEQLVTAIAGMLDVNALRAIEEDETASEQVRQAASNQIEKIMEGTGKQAGGESK